MFGPERDRPCPMCTSFLGSLDVPSVDIGQRLAVAVLGRSPVARQLAFARERGWRILRFYETVGDDFARDYHALSPDDEEGAAVDVWSETAPASATRGAPRAAVRPLTLASTRTWPPDVMLWNILDLTPGGRDTDWNPSLDYGPQPLIR